ncbi:MAG: hypothetical protein ACT4P6_07620 [Gemmatimonadaceae bacterium]
MIKPINTAADESRGPGPRSRRARVLLSFAVALGVPSAAFVALEGFSSLLLFGRALAAAWQPRIQEELSSEFDSELGWVAKRSFSAANLYGPAVSLHTNSRGFRGKEEVADSVPNGKQRAICSGDSFTLGAGVADDAVWCALLQRDDVETVNMGQGGYGIDQAYLWYKRDGLTLDHDVHFLAFVTHDFARMGMTRFLGFGKPKLVVDADSLRATGIPVPRHGRARTTQRALRAVGTLRSAELLGSLTRRDATAQAVARTRLDTTGTRAVFARIVADLKRVNESKQSRLVLVYFPDQTDFVDERALAWRLQVRQIADSLDVPFFDLIPAIRALNPFEAQSLYIQASDARGEFSAVGHFSTTGNQWAAREIRARLDRLGLLAANPAVARAPR